MRQCYIITQSAKKIKSILEFTNSAFSRFFIYNFLAKKCYNSVIERGNLTIPTTRSSEDARLKIKRLFSKIILNSALSEM
jgi:hypothetical protein